MTDKFMEHAHGVCLTKSEAKIVSRLLSLAADRFSNFGCNDFNATKEAGLTAEECAELQEKIWRWNSPNPLPEDLFTDEMFSDSILMSYFSDKLEKR